MLIVIILGGIYGGIFTPTEAAAVAAVYAFFVAVFIYKDLRLTETPRVILEAGKTTVMLMFIICNAFLFAHVLTTEQIPQRSEEHTSELQSLLRTSYAVCCLKKKKHTDEQM